MVRQQHKSFFEILILPNITVLSKKRKNNVVVKKKQNWPKILSNILCFHKIEDK